MSSQSWNVPLFRCMGWTQLCQMRLVLINHTGIKVQVLIHHHSHFDISWRWRTVIDAITECFVIIKKKKKATRNLHVKGQG